MSSGFYPNYIQIIMTSHDMNFFLLLVSGRVSCSFPSTVIACCSSMFRCSCRLGPCFWAMGFGSNPPDGKNHLCGYSYSKSLKPILIKLYIYFFLLRDPKINLMLLLSLLFTILKTDMTMENPPMNEEHVLLAKMGAFSSNRHDGELGGVVCHYFPGN